MQFRNRYTKIFVPTAIQHIKKKRFHLLCVRMKTFEREQVKKVRNCSKYLKLNQHRSARFLNLLLGAKIIGLLCYQALHVNIEGCKDLVISLTTGPLLSSCRQQMPHRRKNMREKRAAAFDIYKILPGLLGHSGTAKAQYRKFETNIPRKGIARGLSPNFHIHVSMSDL
jgi:hypothetical protein